MSREYIPFSNGLEGGMGVPGLMGPEAPGGFINIDEFKKAVTADAVVDPSLLTGGGALRLQSIEPTLLRTMQQDKHFVLLNKLSQSSATATVDEFTVKDQIGGYPGSAYNSETGTIRETSGNYKREIGIVKFLMTKREVTVVQESQKTMVDTIAEEKVDATRELKTSVEWGMFYGDASILSLEFDGIDKQIADAADGDLTKDAAGNGLSYVAQEVIDLAAAVASQGPGRFGTITDLFCSKAVQAREFDQKLDPAFRVPDARGEVSTKMGTPVSAIRTSNGNIGINGDVFVTEGDLAWDQRSGTFPTMATANATVLAPPSSAPTGTPAADAASKFLAAHAGSYYYMVESLGKEGRGPSSDVSNAVVVAAGDKVTVSISHTGIGASTSGFWVHRSRKNGTNAKSDLREMTRVAKGAGPTTYVDLNDDIPGCSTVFLLNLLPGEQAITLRRLLPMTMFPLYPTNSAVRPWAQLFFCYLRMAKPKHAARIRNVLPGGAAWRPF